MNIVHQYTKEACAMSLLYLIMTLPSCIIEYEDKQVKSSGPILVLDGMITNGEGCVRISRSIDINGVFENDHLIHNAIVTIERDDNVVFSDTEYLGDGEYLVQIEDLNPSSKYRFNFVIEGKQYQSEFLHPLITPDFDVEVIKESIGQPVQVTVSTHDPNNNSLYYRWRYNEIWEFKTELFRYWGFENGEMFMYNKYRNTYWCWGRDSSKSLFLGSTEKLQENKIRRKRLFDMKPSDEKLSQIYYLSVKQNQIRQQAFDYFENLQKNIEQTGSIFSPIPSESRGNIICVDNPEEIVIGYIEVSTTELKEFFVPNLQSLYEPPVYQCSKLLSNDSGSGRLLYMLGDAEIGPTYAPRYCLDCTERGTKNKPDFWPSDNF